MPSRLRVAFPPFFSTALLKWLQLRGLCVEFRTSAATAFVGQERDPNEYLDYILLDVSKLSVAAPKDCDPRNPCLRVAFLVASSWLCRLISWA